MDSTPKQILRLRLPFILAGLGLILVCLIPGDLILVNDSNSSILRTQAWMHPFIWPFIGLGVLFILTPFSERLRKNVAPLSIETGILALVIFYGIEPIIRIRLLEFWLNTTIANPDRLEVEISLLMIHWFIAIFLIVGPLIYHLDKRLYRRWKAQMNGPFPRIP
jgi:hypothetical protein